MNRLIILLTILACLSISTIGSLSVAFGAVESEEDRSPVVDILAETVVFINALTIKSETQGDHTNQNDSHEVVKSEGGTAFAIEHNKIWYFVTAKHVVAEASEVKILANSQNGSVTWFPIAKIEKTIPGANWIMHPNADLAIHPILANGIPGFSGRAIMGKTLYGGKTHLLDRLVVIGFPYTIGSDVTSQNLSPVVKETTLVSWPAFRNFVSESNFLVDPPLYPGFSGAPVYSIGAIPGEPLFGEKHTTLVGIYVGGLTIRDASLGRVIPAQTLIELLNSENVRAFERIYKPTEPDHVPQDNSSLHNNH